MALRGGVHLLLEHALVGRADGVLRAAEDGGVAALGQPERVLGDRPADPALDPLGAEGRLGLAFALAPLLRPVGVADRHPHHRDRRVHAGERHDARDPAARADDHLAVDLLAQDPVGRADVVPTLGSDRRALQAEAVLADRRGRLRDHGVLRRAAVLEREVEALQLELDADHVGRERAQRFVEQLLPGLVALEDGDGLGGHSRGLFPADPGEDGEA